MLPESPTSSLPRMDGMQSPLLNFSYRIGCHKLSGIITIEDDPARSTSCVTSADEIIFHQCLVDRNPCINNFSLLFFYMFLSREPLTSNTINSSAFFGTQ